VRFRFLQRPEYITPGARFVFREGRTKGIGVVVGCDNGRSSSNGNAAAPAAQGPPLVGQGSTSAHSRARQQAAAVS